MGGIEMKKTVFRKNRLLAALVIVLAAGAGMMVINMLNANNPTCENRTMMPEALAAPAESGGGGNATGKNVLDSRLAGSWYSKDAETLQKEIDGYLAAIEGDTLADVQALILPHAGYRFSGQTAAYGLRHVKGGDYNRVIIIGPTHRMPMENIASLPDATHYATPLGETPLDLDFIEKLKTYPLFRHVPGVHENEHSVQIELPLLQAVLDEFQLVPMVAGQLDLETARKMGRILGGLIDEKTLVVASTDFTHYGPNFRYQPFREDVENNLRELDMGAVEFIRNRDAAGFMSYISETGATICGRYPVAVLLSMLSENTEAHILRYDTSGNITGDFSNSVSYCTIAFTGSWPDRGEAPVEKEAAARLDDTDKERLLELARETIAVALRERKAPEAEDLSVEITPAMKAVRGSFVTLKIGQRLRGCIGDIFPSRPLFKSVISNAVNAAFNDRRFSPLTQEEFEKVHIEISALTPQEPVDSWRDIEVGKHGVVLSKGSARAVFLPQVAPEQGWDRDTMLTRLAMKAGLPADAWKEGASFTVFEAEVFGEEAE
jgi:MEMO1 family protein